jgi:predicted dehydrogenase
MRFALLGADPDALDLARAVAGGGEHTLVSAHDLGDGRALVGRELSGVRIVEHWEGLLAGEVDAVIVARAADDDLRAEQLRKLVQAAVPLIVSHPVHDSMLVYYELEMIREESHAIVYPYVPGLGHPALAKIGELIETTAIGRLEQVLIERALSARDRRRVLAAFVRDMELSGPLCGTLSKVGAMAPGEAVGKMNGNYANLNVQMSGSAGALVRWSVVPVEDRATTRFSFVGSRGKAVLFVPADDGPWTLETRLEGAAASSKFDPWNSAAFALARFADAVAGPPVQPDWIAASRTMELADAIEHSLQRGRTIDLHYEAPSEQSTFKGLMAGAGCFLLIGGLVLTVLAMMAVKLGVPLAAHWPKLLLGLLAGFLLLQLLRFAFPHQGDDVGKSR